MAEARRKRGTQEWHWSAGCSNYPTSSYERLPAVPHGLASCAECATDGAPSMKCAPPMKPLRILLVDDYDVVREGLATLLEMSGHEVLQAKDGDEALLKMRSEFLDVIVLDLHLPIVTGRAVLNERAADPTLLTIPVIISSGEDLPTNDPVLSGICVFLQKPYRIDELEAAIAACCGDEERTA